MFLRCSAIECPHFCGLITRQAHDRIVTQSQFPPHLFNNSQCNWNRCLKFRDHDGNAQARVYNIQWHPAHRRISSSSECGVQTQQMIFPAMFWKSFAQLQDGKCCCICCGSSHLLLLLFVLDAEAPLSERCVGSAFFRKHQNGTPLSELPSTKLFSLGSWCFSSFHNWLQVNWLLSGVSRLDDSVCRSSVKHNPTNLCALPEILFRPC